MSPLKQVFRRLGHSPVFSLLALATLAVGIGANTAIFSVIDSVLIKPLPYPDAERLIGVWHVAPGLPNIGNNLNMSPSMYYTYREQNKTFEHIGIWADGDASVTGSGDPEEVRVLFFTHGVLDALEVKPLLGRWFSEADDQNGAARTAILSYGFWQRRFGGDRSILGRTITTDSVSRTVIGVMPQEFRFQGSDAALIFPMQFDRSKLHLGGFGYTGVARLKPGVTLQQADADVARMIGIWINAWPTPLGFSHALFETAHFGPKLQPLKQEVVGDIGKTLWVLMATLALVLLIACANVANLMLVRAEGRRQEMAIRAALGAGWGRIARELLLESVTLGLVGGALGLGLAYAALRLLVAKGPQSLPRLAEIGIDPAALAFTLGVSLFTGLLFGAIPAFKYAGPKVAAAMRGSGRTFSEGRERHRARNTLVVVQVALALVLLVGAGLMIRTFQALRKIEPGYAHPEHVQLVRIAIAETQVPENDRVMNMEREMLDKLAAIPGVTSVAFTSAAPLEGFNSSDPIFAKDRTYGQGEIPPIRRFRFQTPGVFNVTGTRMLTGRDFTWTDLTDKRHVAIVSQTMARETWGSAQAAMGKYIHVAPQEPWREVVGVVEDVREDGTQLPAPAIVYWPARRDMFEGNPDNVIRGGAFVIRTSRAGTESLIKDARKAIWSVNSNLPVFLIRTLQGLSDSSMARTSFTLVMLAISGAAALLLGVIGIYGVIAYAVSQRTREIGIRVALGAEPARVRRMFLGYGLTLAAVGAAIGAVAAAGLTRLMASVLYGVKPLDPITYGAVALVLATAAGLASYIPARRATDIDPVEALRAQ